MKCKRREIYFYQTDKDPTSDTLRAQRSLDPRVLKTSSILFNEFTLF